MKKNLFIKIIMALLVVLLAFAVVACGPKKGGDEDGENGGGKKTETDGATMEDIAGLLAKFKPLLQQVELIENEMHIDATIALRFEDMDYKVRVQADIYGDEPAENQAAIILKGSEDEKLLEAYLKDGVIYLNQKLTATKGATKFTKLEGLEINEMLSKIPQALSDADLKLADLIDKLSTSLAGLEFVNDLIAEAFTYEVTDNEYILGVNAEGLGSLVGGLLPVVAKDGFGEFQDLVDFGIDFLFGVTLDELIDEDSNIDTSKFPTIKISALREGDKVNGLKIYYKGDLDKDTPAQEELEIGIMANVDDDAVLTGDHAIAFPNFSNYEEGALKASLTIDLGEKDLYLKADILADPDFSVVGGEKSRPTAYLAAYNSEGEKIADLDALYDGYTLYFDIAGLYEIVGLEPQGNTQYKVDFDFFAEAAPEEDDGDVDGDDTQTTEPGAPLPFKINPNLLTTILGKLPDVIDLVKDAILNKEIALNVNQVLTLINGVLVVNDEEGKTIYGKENIIADLNELLAKFAADYDEEETYSDEQLSDLAQSVIFEFSGVDVSVADIVNATKSSANNVYVTLGLLEDALGIELDITKGTSTGVLNVKVELDIVKASDYKYTETSEAKDYDEAIDLNSEDNIYEVDGVKHYVILDELLILLDAYRALGAK